MFIAAKPATASARTSRACSAPPPWASWLGKCASKPSASSAGPSAGGSAECQVIAARPEVQMGLAQLEVDIELADLVSIDHSLRQIVNVKGS